MRKLDSQETKPKSSFTYLLAALIGQVGCLTLVIILAAVLGGLTLDNKFGTKPWITAGLLVLSIPISLLVMFSVARKASAKMKEGSKKDHQDEEDGIGKEA